MNRPEHGETAEEALLDRGLRVALSRRSAALRQASRPSDPLPAHAGHHDLGAEIGRGGMAVVVRAEDTQLERTVALKILGSQCADDPVLVTRFLREAHICARLQHPGIVPVHASGRLEDGRPWFSMREIRGETLADRLERLQSTTPSAQINSELMAIFESVCKTMAYAHHQGVVHGDLKPSNVMLGAFGEVLVLDWGLAQLESEPLAAGASRVLGTPAYMAPELATGRERRPTKRTDVFALGAMLVEILCGTPVWVGATRQQILEEARAADLLSCTQRLAAANADAELTALALDCLGVDLEARPSDANAVSQRIADWHVRLATSRHEAELARTRAEANAIQERRIRKRNFLLASSAIVIVLGGSGLLEWGRRARVDEANALVARLAATVDQAISLRDAVHKNDNSRASAYEQAIASLNTANAHAERAPEWIRLRISSNLEHTKRLLQHHQADTDAVEVIRRTRADLSREPAATRALTYARLFERLGLRLNDDATDTDSAGQAVAQHRLHHELVPALDDWVHLAMQQGTLDLAKRLIAVVNAADPHPFRREVRSASAAGDVARLTRIAVEARNSVLDRDSALLLAQALIATGSLKTAEETLRAIQALHPIDARVNQALGTFLAGRLNDADGALRHLMLALAAEPSSITLRSIICNTLLMARRSTEARRFAQEMLELNATSNDALHHLGGAALVEGKLDEAIVHLGAAIAAAPENSQGHRLMGLALRSKGDRLGMVASLRRAYALDPHGPSSGAILAGALQELHQHAEALPLLLTAVQSAADDPMLRFSLARSQSQLGMAAASAENYRLVTEQRQNWAEAWCNLGLELRVLGQADRAAEALRRGHELGSARGAAWAYPSAQWLAEAETEAAITSRLPTLSPSEEQALSPDQALLCGRQCAASGDHVRAARLLQRATTALPEALYEGTPTNAFLLARSLSVNPAPESNAEAVAVLRALLASLTSSSEADGRLSDGALTGLVRLSSDATFAEWFDKATARAEGDANARAIIALRDEWLRTLTDARSAYLR